MPEIDSTWYRQHFNEDYRTLYAARDDAEAEAQVGFALQQLEIQAEDRVLDLCCGHGRHLEALAKRNIRATGVDLSLPLLKEALARGSGPLLRADMRKLPFAGGAEGFSVLLNFFTSFGYFQEEKDNLAVIEEIENQGMMDNATKTGALLKERLKGLMNRFPFIGDVRGEGLLLAFELVSDRMAMTPFPASLGLYDKLVEIAYSKGLIIYSRRTRGGYEGDHFLVCPPMIATEAHVDEIIETLTESLAELEADIGPLLERSA